ncbi:hypothetical protein [Mycobacterium sp. NPDC004974]
MIIKLILAALTGRCDRQSRRNALGRDEEPEFIDLDDYLDTVTEAELRRQQAAFASGMLSPALAAVAGDAPGEESGDPLAPPSPGEPNLAFPDESEIHLWPDSLVLTHAANCLPWPGNARLVGELRDRAAQFEAAESEPDEPVREDDLAAHITATLDDIPRFDISSELASSLLADYRITKK